MTEVNIVLWDFHYHSQTHLSISAVHQLTEKKWGTSGQRPQEGWGYAMYGEGISPSQVGAGVWGVGSAPLSEFFSTF